MSLIAIDFEASCLPVHGRSFPIEVGISTDGHTARSWLIRPAPGWAGWCWTGEAQALHGISRDQLERHGLPAAQVLRELEACVGSARLIADSDLDGRWLRTLAEAAKAPARFRIDHIALLLDEWRCAEATIEAAVTAADRAVARRHRAGEDARWLAIVMARLHDASSGGAPTPLFGWEEQPVAAEPALVLA